ncbi:hypothetical protein KSS87_017119 [Heliosperma pusillum]|nr:hypothetical protein KSS87_017119 [Heliosperma pusillum]
MSSTRLRESVLGMVGDAAQNCPLPRHFFNMHNRDLTERIEAGSFYEINHAKLPIDAPSVLYTLRAVMVTANTEQNVTIRYPSIQSLQAFFAKADRLAIRSKLYPATDGKYVMEPKLAVKVLGHQISSREFHEHRHSKSFWLINCSKPEQLGLPASMYGAADNIAKNGTCFSTLQSCGMKWGFRQTQIVQPCTVNVKQPDDADEAMSALSNGDDQYIVKEEEIHEVEVKLEETPDIKLKEIIQYSRKRKRGKSVRSQYRKTKRNPKQKPLENLSKVEVNEGDRVDRWSFIRYETAVKQLIEVLNAHKASYSHPITRATLRTEARKRIGDTGLLDHLLKHLAGKVVPSGGNLRLRRRCAPDGKMEYWLESADLVSIRKEAGIQDPYWTPPPGWKCGDSISSHNCICCEQVRLLKDELNSLRRKETEPEFKENKQHTVTMELPDSAAYPRRLNKANLNVTNSKDSYEALVKKKSLMEEQFHKMSKALVELEEEMKKVKSQKGVGALKPVMITYSKRLSGEETSEESSERDDEAFGRGRPRACRRVREDVTVTPPTASPHSTTTSIADAFSWQVFSGLHGIDDTPYRSPSGMGRTVGDVINDKVEQHVQSTAMKKCGIYRQGFEDGSCLRTLHGASEKDLSKCQFYKDMLCECRNQSAISMKHHHKVEVYYLFRKPQLLVCTCQKSFNSQTRTWFGYGLGNCTKDDEFYIWTSNNQP